MKKVMQDLSKGGIELIESPPPQVKSGCLLIDTTVSLISTGTERMLIDFGRSGIVAKARAQPEKVAQVIDKAKTEGFITTLDAVRSKMAKPIPLGYSNVGVVRESFAEGFQVVIVLYQIVPMRMLFPHHVIYALRYQILFLMRLQALL